MDAAGHGVDAVFDGLELCEFDVVEVGSFADVASVSAPPDSRRCLGSSPELSRRWSPELSRSCGVVSSGGLGVRVVGSLTY